MFHDIQVKNRHKSRFLWYLPVLYDFASGRKPFLRLRVKKGKEAESDAVDSLRFYYSVDRCYSNRYPALDIEKSENSCTLVDRQTHNGKIVAVNPFNKNTAESLDSIGTCLIHRFFRLNI